MLTYDIKQAFLIKWVYLGVFLTLGFVTVAHLDTIMEIIQKKELLPADWTKQFVTEVATGKEMLFFLPVICTFPYASSFVDECKSGMIRFALSRVSRKRYLLSKVLVTALSGGMISASGLSGVVLAANIFFLPLEQKSENVQDMVQAGSVDPQLFLRYFIWGALGALTGLWISALVRNRYMAFMGPFMGKRKTLRLPIN